MSSEVRLTLGVAAVLVLIALFWRLLGMLLRFALRAGVGGGVLAAMGTLPGLHLGVNVFNCALIGLLGAPGLGLLLMLNWLLW